MIFCTFTDSSAICSESGMRSPSPSHMPHVIGQIKRMRRFAVHWFAKTEQYIWSTHLAGLIAAWIVVIVARVTVSTVSTFSSDGSTSDGFSQTLQLPAHCSRTPIVLQKPPTRTKVQVSTSAKSLQGSYFELWKRLFYKKLTIVEYYKFLSEVFLVPEVNINSSAVFETNGNIYSV